MFGLTQGAIGKLLQIQFGINESFVVEITKLKAKDKYNLFRISDGKASHKGFIDVTEEKKNLEALIKKTGCQPLRIKIVEHITHSKEDDERHLIEIVQFQLPKQSKNHIEVAPNHKIYQPKLEHVFKPKNFLHSIKKQSIQNSPSERARLPISHQKYDQETQECQKSNINIKNFQIISDLYESFYAWELLTRVTDVKYQQFMSKAGKLTKILSVELIDRLGWIVTGKFFGDVATARQSMINQGKIYRVSRGRIVEDKYLNKTNDKQSKFTILFNKDTQFHELKDIPHIPYVPINWLRLSEVANLPVSDKTYSFIGMLTEIYNEVSTEKQGRTIVFQHFKIGDPITELVYQCTVWSRQLKIDQNLLGKSIIIKNFRICEYKNQATLATTFRSDLAYHPAFSKFDDDLQHFKVLSKEAPAKTLGQIAYDISQERLESIYTVEVWVSEIFFNKKWYYESCPKCKKTCPSYTKCPGCSFDLGQSSKRFKIPIQLSDFTGAIWTTSFDQTASIFLKNAQINELLKMDLKDLIELGNGVCFNQFRMQIATKKDQSGRMNYSIIGKPIPVDFAHAAARNLEQIQDITARKQLKK